jgi:hypothetical protein
MSVFYMDRMEQALDGMVPAPAVEVGMENEINHSQGAQDRRGPVMRTSKRNCICNLELEEEDNLAKVARANVLPEDMEINPDNPPTNNQEAVTNTTL